MVMGLFGNNRRRSDITLIFDIGSSSVGGALVQYEEGVTPLVLFSVRKEIPFKENFDFDQYYSSMLRSLEEVTIDILSSLSSSVEDVADSLRQSGGRIVSRRSYRKIQNIYCIFSSPWYSARIIDIEHDFGKEVPITPDGVWEFIKEATERVHKEFSDPTRIGVLEKRVLEYRLNGYRIDDPLSLRAKTAALKVYLSVVSKNTISAVKAPIRKITSFRKIRSFSFIMIYFSLMRDAHPDTNSFMLIDMRGEVTEVGVVKEDVLTQAFSVPRGRHSLLRAISEKLAIELFEADSKLSLFLTGKLEGQAKTEIEQLIASEVSEMKVFLKRHLEGEIYLPDQVYILSESEMETVAERAARSFYEDTLVLPEIAILSGHYFEQLIRFSKPRYEDRFLALQALYFKGDSALERE